MLLPSVVVLMLYLVGIRVGMYQVRWLFVAYTYVARNTMSRRTFRSCLIYYDTYVVPTAYVAPRVGFGGQTLRPDPREGGRDTGFGRSSSI
jgi:hypothetical protein